MVLPSMQQLLELGDIEEYPYEKSFAFAKSDPAFVLHTSGSTGDYHQWNSVFFAKPDRDTEAFDLYQ
jgi:hypothetical protein